VEVSALGVKTGPTEEADPDRRDAPGDLSEYPHLQRLEPALSQNPFRRGVRTVAARLVDRLDAELAT